MIDWIKTEERKPEKTCRCLVWVKQEEMEYDSRDLYFRKEDGYSYTGFGMEVADPRIKVLAWCEIQNPEL